MAVTLKSATDARAQRDDRRENPDLYREPHALAFKRMPAAVRVGKRKVAPRYVPPVRLNGVDLAKRCEWAVRTATRAKRARVSESEACALAGEVALRAIDTFGPYPLRSEASGGWTQAVAENLLTGDGAASRGWRDSAASYRTASERERPDDLPRFVPLTADDGDDDGPRAGRTVSLADAAMRAAERRGEALTGEPQAAADLAPDALALAATLTQRLAERASLTTRQRDGLRVAILAAAMQADGTGGSGRKGAPALAVIAVRTGRSLKATTKRSSEGGKLLRAMLTPDDLAALTASIARERAARRDRRADALDLSPELAAALDLAALAVDRAKRAYRTADTARTVPSRGWIGDRPSRSAPTGTALRQWAPQRADTLAVLPAAVTVPVPTWSESDRHAARRVNASLAAKRDRHR